jgi:hypothetical protein
MVPAQDWFMHGRWGESRRKQGAWAGVMANVGLRIATRAAAL